MKWLPGFAWLSFPSRTRQKALARQPSIALSVQSPLSRRRVLPSWWPAIPTIPNGGYLLPVKNNLAPLGKGFAFRLEQRIVGDPGKGIVVSTVAWETAPVDITVDAALQAADAQAGGGMSAGAEAEQFLKEMLAAAAAPQKEIKDAAEGAGMAWATVRRAKDRLGIKAYKDGMGGGWYWALPKMLNDAEGAHLNNMNTFGANEHLRGNGAVGSSIFEANDGLEISQISRSSTKAHLMTRRPATIIQADVARVIRAAKQAGAAEVEVRVGDTSIVVRIASSTGVQSSLETSEQIIL